MKKIFSYRNAVMAACDEEEYLRKHECSTGDYALDSYLNCYGYNFDHPSYYRVWDEEHRDLVVYRSLYAAKAAVVLAKKRGVNATLNTVPAGNGVL